LQALELAREQGDSIKDQIWRELAKARCAMNVNLTGIADIYIRNQEYAGCGCQYRDKST